MRVDVVSHRHALRPLGDAKLETTPSDVGVTGETCEGTWLLVENSKVRGRNAASTWWVMEGSPLN